MNFTTGTYTGDGGTSKTIAVGFLPNLAIVKVQSAGTAQDAAVIRTDQMPSNTSYWMDSHTSSTALVRSFTSTGFTVGNNPAVNASSQTYIWMAWGMPASNPGYEMEVFSYTGNGSTADRVISLATLTAKPSVLMIKSTDPTNNKAYWMTEDFGTGVCLSFTENSEYDSRSAFIRSLGANSFTVGTALNVNAATYYYGAWRSSSSLHRTLYVGDGIDSKKIPSPFRAGAAWIQGFSTEAGRVGAGNEPALFKTESHSGEYCSNFTDGEDQTNRIQEFGFNYIGIGSDEQVNRSKLAYACLSGRSRIVMADGNTARIIDLVRGRSTAEVRTYDSDIRRFTSRRITGWYEFPYRGPWFKIELKHGRRNGAGYWGAYFTPDHQVLTSRGWLPTRDIAPGSWVATGERALSPLERSALLGSLLGDGMLCRKGHRASFRAGHCIAQLPYLQYKQSLLDGLHFHIRKACLPRQSWEGRIVQSTPFSVGETSPHTGIAQIADLTYPRGQKTITAAWLSEVDELGLALWYLDDGTLAHRRGMSARFSTHSRSLNEVILLKEWLRSRFGLNAVMDEVRPQQYCLRLNKESTYRLAELIRPFVIPEMQYKLPPEYRGGTTAQIPACDDVRPQFDLVTNVISKVFAGRGAAKGRAMFCIDVEGTHNFVTLSAIAHNCVAFRGTASETDEETFTYQPTDVEDVATYIDRSDTDANYSSLDTLNIGSSYSGGDAYRTIVELPVGAIPVGSVITGATAEYPVDQAPTGTLSCVAYRLTRYEWKHDEATWDSFRADADWTVAGGDYDSEDSALFSISGSTCQITGLARLVQSSLSDGKFSLPLLMKTVSVGTGFASLKHVDLPSGLPKLTITYRPPEARLTGGFREVAGSWITKGGLAPRRPTHMAWGGGTASAYVNPDLFGQLVDEVYRKPVNVQLGMATVVSGLIHGSISTLGVVDIYTSQAFQVSNPIKLTKTWLVGLRGNAIGKYRLRIHEDDGSGNPGTVLSVVEVDASIFPVSGVFEDLECAIAWPDSPLLFSGRRYHLSLEDVNGWAGYPSLIRTPTGTIVVDRYKISSDLVSWSNGTNASILVYVEGEPLGEVRFLSTFGVEEPDGTVREVGIFDGPAQKLFIDDCEAVGSWSGSSPTLSTDRRMGSYSIRFTAPIEASNASLGMDASGYSIGDMLQLWVKLNASYDGSEITVRIGNDSANYWTKNLAGEAWNAAGTQWYHMTSYLSTWSTIGSPTFDSTINYIYLKVANLTNGTYVNIDDLRLLPASAGLIARAEFATPYDISDAAATMEFTIKFTEGSSELQI